MPNQGVHYDKIGVIYILKNLRVLMISRIKLFEKTFSSKLKKLSRKKLVKLHKDNKKIQIENKRLKGAIVETPQVLSFE